MHLESRNWDLLITNRSGFKTTSITLNKLNRLLKILFFLFKNNALVYLKEYKNGTKPFFIALEVSNYHCKFYNKVHSRSGSDGFQSLIPSKCSQQFWFLYYNIVWILSKT